MSIQDELAALPIRPVLAEGDIDLSSTDPRYVLHISRSRVFYSARLALAERLLRDMVADCICGGQAYLTGEPCEDCTDARAYLAHREQET